MRLTAIARERLIGSDGSPILGTTPETKHHDRGKLCRLDGLQLCPWAYLP